MNDLSDAELMRLSRRNPRETGYREELWDRADKDTERGDLQLAADLERNGIKRVAA